jgi:hypothetical protein
MRTLLIASSSIFAALCLSAQAQDLGGKEDARPQPSTAETAVPTDSPTLQDAAAATPSAAAASATISGSSGAVFKAKVGSYPMSHYASPSRPIPYDQLDAYLKASRRQQMARNWWGGSELAATASSGAVSTTVSNSTAGIPNDTNVSINTDTQAPISDVQRELNASGLSGTPKQTGQLTAPPNDALTPGAPAAEGLPEPTP